MEKLEKPYWEKGIMTGIKGIGYRVGEAIDLVLLADFDTPLGDNSERVWNFILWTSEKRNTDLEKRVLDENKQWRILYLYPFGDDLLLSICEKNLNQLLSLMRNMFSH